MKTNPISPKVIVAVVIGIILTSVVSNVGSIDPSAFDFLGPWKLFVLGTLLTAIMGLAAWWKTDPLRILPEDQPKPVEPAPAASAGSPAVQVGPGTVAQAPAVVESTPVVGVVAPDGTTPAPGV